ncbi:lipocalin family protein [Flavivirga eckloniae]|uniref:Lipocalin-like domain-containing protein n=1 Tax=Flavivirga eckloniae TaxID=1803846 RepID=A0A2K9PKZ1_9FLAO|nr:lipocalin family protein [Flavivirga eckloniae]AUP77508.1 hypothetical protein C1H87_01740 [Flavivirga eckloniae]
MKRLTTLFIAFALVLTVFCSNGYSERSNKFIIGTWKVISDVEDDEEFVKRTDCDVLYTFTQNTITIEEFTGENCKGLVQNLNNTWPYSIANNVIVGFNVEESQEVISTYDYEIVELTDTTLKIKYEEEGYVNRITMTRQ